MRSFRTCTSEIVSAAQGIVINYRASIRAANLEKELEDSRIAIMLSQIKPHFLYNVLNTIYHLYRKEPETAQEAVSSFAKYLRCNMLSIWSEYTTGVLERMNKR